MQGKPLSEMTGRRPCVHICFDAGGCSAYAAVSFLLSKAGSIAIKCAEHCMAGCVAVTKQTPIVLQSKSAGRLNLTCPPDTIQQHTAILLRWISSSEILNLDHALAVWRQIV